MLTVLLRLPRWLSGKESACQCRRCRFNPWVRKLPWRRQWQPIPIFLPEKSHGQRSLVGYSPWGHKESDMTERLNRTELMYVCALPWWLSGKEFACQCRRLGFDPCARKIPWRREWQRTPVFLPGKFHGQRSLAGYSPQSHKELDTT